MTHQKTKKKMEYGSGLGSLPKLFHISMIDLVPSRGIGKMLVNSFWGFDSQLKGKVLW